LPRNGKASGFTDFRFADRLKKIAFQGKQPPAFRRFRESRCTESRKKKGFHFKKEKPSLCALCELCVRNLFHTKSAKRAANFFFLSFCIVGRMSGEFFIFSFLKALC
jgi:hypothetical protein